MAISKFDSGSIAGGVKDIAGTIIEVVMLVVAIKALRPKKKTVGGFEAKFHEEMEKVISKYSPLIEKDAAVQGRYNIADNMLFYIRILTANITGCLISIARMGYLLSSAKLCLWVN
jgi:hypothetical protein